MRRVICARGAADIETPSRSRGVHLRMKSCGWANRRRIAGIRSLLPMVYADLRSARSTGRSAPGLSRSNRLSLANLCLGKWRSARLHHLAQTLIPLAGCGVFLGLTTTTLNILRADQIHI